VMLGGSATLRTPGQPHRGLGIATLWIVLEGSTMVCPSKGDCKFEKSANKAAEVEIRE
jgi:hypothetical protein